MDSSTLHTVLADMNDYYKVIFSVHNLQVEYRLARPLKHVKSIVFQDDIEYDVEFKSLTFPSVNSTEEIFILIEHDLNIWKYQDHKTKLWKDATVNDTDINEYEYNVKYIRNMELIPINDLNYKYEKLAPTSKDEFKITFSKKMGNYVQTEYTIVYNGSPHVLNRDHFARILVTRLESDT
jgi:hypothetical protein